MSVKKTRTRSKWHWKLLLPLVLVVVLMIGGGLFLLTHRHKNTAVTGTSQTNQTSGVHSQNTIDYSPAKPADNATNEDRKSSDSPSSTLTGGSSSSSSTSAVSVIITNTSHSGNTVSVRNQVEGVTSGTCTATASQSGQANVVQNSTVGQDVNLYDCGVIQLNLPAGGTWNITLSVTSGSAHGSASTTVTI